MKNLVNKKFILTILLIMLLTTISCLPIIEDIIKLELIIEDSNFVKLGEKVELKVLLYYGENNTKDITNFVDWNIDYKIGLINRGVLDAQYPGVATIKAHYKGLKSNLVTVGVIDNNIEFTLYPQIERILLTNYEARYYAVLKFHNSRELFDVSEFVKWYPTGSRISIVRPGLIKAEDIGTVRVGALFEKFNIRAESQIITIYSSEGPDSDGDGLPDAVELIIGTDPYNPDTDGDGLSDGLEVIGLPYFDLPAYGCDPLRKDLLLQLDWMEATGGVIYEPPKEILQLLAMNFSNAPVTNPDGSTGITLHIDAGVNSINFPVIMSKGGNAIPFVESMENLSYADEYKVKHQNNARLNTFRYGLIGHKYNNSNSSGLAYQGGYTFITTLSTYNSFEPILLGTLMHEFGHNLGLHHAGNSASPNFKPNYNSVMNYRYQFEGIDNTYDGIGNGIAYDESTGEPIYSKFNNKNLFTYSSGVLPDLDENNLDENFGLNGTQPIDWNNDGIIEDSVKADINVDFNGYGDGIYEILKDHDDWNNLVYHNTLHTLDSVKASMKSDEKPNFSKLYSISEEYRDLPVYIKD